MPLVIAHDDDTVSIFSRYSRPITPPDFRRFSPRLRHAAHQRRTHSAKTCRDVAR